MPSKAAIDAAKTMAIRLGGAALDVLYANDGELLKDYCTNCIKLIEEALEVND